MLFIFGAALGSFLNVVAERYDPDKFLFARPVWAGRSHCDGCKKTLSWYELIPLLSFLIQRGRCRSCGIKLSGAYPLSEFLAGLIVAIVPWRLMDTAILFFPGLLGASFYFVAAILILIFLAILLLALIDARLHIIPDEITIFLGILGILLAFVLAPYFNLTSGSFLGHFSLLAGIRGNIFLNRLVGALTGFFFLFVLFAITKGRGMGFGDVKLSFSLGLILGWPDVIIGQVFAFILGSLYGIYKILNRNKSLKSYLAFGPFLGMGTILLFLYGYEIVGGYFALFRLW